jgi:hypothetical protein
MTRRQLIESSLVAGTALAAASAEAVAQPRGAGGGSPELYELRAYKLRLGGQVKVVNDFLGEVYLPLLNKLGVRPVGAFTQTFGPEAPTVFLLSPYPSLAAFGATQDKIAAELPKLTTPAAQAFLSPPTGQPAYQRIDSQLLIAFDSFRKLELPAASAKKEPRIFELRIYENPGELGHAKKVDMFGPKMGEMAIFRKVGLQPVMFARSLIGPRQPNFAYILTFPDLAGREAAWKRFREDPDWLKLRATPGYSDAEIMANITDLILTPTAYSQI